VLFNRNQGIRQLEGKVQFKTVKIYTEAGSGDLSCHVHKLSFQRPLMTDAGGSLV
jgi:hypothetical protein